MRRLAKEVEGEMLVDVEVSLGVCFPEGIDREMINYTWL
jgi:hypothetical protein